MNQESQYCQLSTVLYLKQFNATSYQVTVIGWCMLRRRQINVPNCFQTWKQITITLDLKTIKLEFVLVTPVIGT